MTRVRILEMENLDLGSLRRRSLSQLHQLDDEVDNLQRRSKAKDHRLISNVDNILQFSQQPLRMHRASSLPPPTSPTSAQVGGFRYASPSPYDPNTSSFYFLPTSHLRASSAAPSSVYDTNSALENSRRVLRRASISHSYNDLDRVDPDLSAAANRGIRHAYGVQRVILVPQVTRIRNIPLPRKPAVVQAVPSQERRRIERHLDSLVSYEMPSPENFTNMRNRLKSVNERIGQHKTMIDRYTGVDLNPQPSVDDRINEKYLELVSRMPELEGNRNPGRRHSVDYANSSNYAVKGYSQGLLPGGGPPVSELRGRIRRLITRTRRDPNYFRQ